MTRPVQEDILAAFDREEEATDAVVPEVEEPEGQPAEEPEIGEIEEPEEAEEPEAEEPDTGEEEEEEGGPDEEIATEGFASDDPEIQAYLAKYKGDVEKALRGAAEAYRLIGRRDEEREVLARQVEELASELERVNALSRVTYLSEEQQAWVEAAIETGDPRSAVKAAVDAGQFDLARGVCELWAQEAPYDAARIASQVDQIEQRHNQRLFQQQASQPIDHGQLLNALADQFPDLRNYEEQMTATLQKLGDQHHLVRAARGNDIDAAAQAIMNIYEIARASTVTVSKARAQVKQKQRQEADEARNGAVVSSAEATPAASQTPRQRMVTPGLSFDALNEAFENASK